MPLTLNLFVATEEGVLTEVELFQDESVTLTQTLQNIKDISKVFTDFTKTFAVPASKNNNKLFEHFYRFEIDGFTSRQKKAAQLYLNHQLFKKGKVKLESVKMKNNAPHTYNLTFFGEAINLKDFLGEDLLGGLSYLSNFSFDYNATNVIAALQNGQDYTINVDGQNEQYDDAIIVPLITHTERLTYDSSSNSAGSKNLFVSSSVVQGCPFEQLKPALRVYTIIKAIEDKYNTVNGYSQDIKFSRDFFNKDNPDFYNLYLWLHRKKGGVLEDSSIVQQCKNWGRMEGTDANKAVWRSKVKSGYWVLREPSNSKTVNLTHRIIIHPQAGTGVAPFDLFLEKDGEESFRQSFTSADLNARGVFDTDTIDDDAGEYRLFISSETSQSFEIELILNERVVKFFSPRNQIVTVWGSVDVTTTAEFNTAVQLPKIKLLDFLTGLFKMFNLVAYQNNAGTIIVEPLNDFYNNSTTSYDITEYLDTTESTVENVLPFAKINFKYKGLDSFFAADHNERFGLNWGSLKFGGTEKVEGKEFKVELPFEHHKFERLFDANTGNTDITTAQFGWSVNEDQESYLGEPLLFYPVKVTSGTAISVLTSSSSQNSLTQYYIPSNSLALTSSQTIHFGAEVNEYALQPFNDSLYKTFYDTYIAGVFNPATRLYKFKAYLPLRILLNMTLADKFIVFDTLYKVNSIKTNFTTGLSELELINEVQDFEIKDNPKDLGDLISKNYITIDSTKLTVDTIEQTVD